jgi:hypothetical protein
LPESGIKDLSFNNQKIITLLKIVKINQWKALKQFLNLEKGFKMLNSKKKIKHLEK